MTKENQSGPDGAGVPSKGTGQTPRRRAEEVFRKKTAGIPENLEALSPEETRQTLHELRVHQIELEMQNEELRRAQAELEASRARYFDLYDLAPVGYCTVSEKGLILEANLTAATLLGVARGALVKQLLTRFILRDDQAIYFQLRKQLFETDSTSSGQAGETQACELRMVKMDGTAFWVHLEATAARDAGGAPVCRVVLSDITGRKQAEAALQQAHDELEQRVTERTGELRQANEKLRADIAERKQVEKALRDSDARYRTLFTRAVDGIFILSANGELVEVNESLARMHGYSTQEMLHMNLKDLDTPETSQRAPERLRRLLAGESLTFKVEHYHKDGHVFPIEVSASLISSGGESYIQCFHRNITERRRAESEIQALARFPSENPNPILRIALDGTLLYVNGAGLSQLPDWHLQAGRGVPSMMRDVVSEALNSGKERLLDLKHRERVYSFFVAPIVGAGYANLYGRDITERIRGEETLKESEERYRSLAASVDSMYLTDRDCTYLFMNEGHRMRFDLPLEEIIGRRYGGFHSEEDTKEFANCIREVYGTGKPIIKEHWSERDGRYFLRTFTPIMGRSPVGEISKVVIVSKDITERKQAEKDLIETLQQLQETRDMLIQFEKHAAVGRLAAGVAHEILNPASIISSRLQFLEEENLSEPAKENVRISLEQLQRIVKISHDLLQSFSKKLTVSVGGDLRHVIEVGLQMTERRIKEDHVQVEYDPSPEVIPVKMERDRLVKVMVNLILNACDAMTGEHSKRMIIAVYRPEVSSRRPFVRLIVTDNGHGILAGELDKIFEPFFTRKDPGKGTGLGLSVSKGIIQEHGGTIHAENNDMGGASFIVELPLDHP